MIKVIHVMPQIGTGGAERQLYELIVHSDPAKVHHQVFYYSDGKDDEMLKAYRAKNIALIRVPRSKNNPIRFLLDFAKMIREENPGIVHCWLVSGNFWGRLAAICAGVKHVIVAWRSSKVWKPMGYRLLEWVTSWRVQHLANSRACACNVAKAIGVSPDRFAVIYNGIDVNLYNATAQNKMILKGMNIPEGYKVVAMVGRLTEAKNYPMLLRTAKRCKDWNLRVHFLVAGHGEKEMELKALASELDVSEIVHFLGIRMDTIDILKASDIFCYTSWYEGFPNALLEAMTAGLPVVAADFDGVRELVTGPEVGIIVPPDDDDAAAEAIQDYLDDPGWAESVGGNARKFVQSNFAMPVMVEKTMEFYQKMMDKQS